MSAPTGGVAIHLPRHTYTRTLVGPLSANATKLLDEHRKSGIFFLFQDLSVRTEGLSSSAFLMPFFNSFSYFRYIPTTHASNECWRVSALVSQAIVVQSAYAVLCTDPPHQKPAHCLFTRAYPLSWLKLSQNPLQYSPQNVSQVFQVRK